MSLTNDDVKDLSQFSKEPGDFLEGEAAVEDVSFEEEDEEEQKDDEEQKEDTGGLTLSHYCTVSLDILEFDFSYGYNCRKPCNLIVVDPEHVVFASGNYLHILNITNKSVWFKRSELGGGIGDVKMHPSRSILAVAESGRRPLIFVYEWPSFETLHRLSGGAMRIYANMDFSRDGALLVSQSGEPDFLITVWEWEREHILLRSKSYVNEVFKVRFSPYVPGSIVSCGESHIKFWTMATTFTGLKLKGEIGRFGKTEYSDILGVLPMPDGKVVSGCAWGNILVWDRGLIALEVFRTQRRFCHSAPVSQFYYYDGELWSIALDGHICLWWYEKIDQADPPDDDRVVLLDPSYEFYTPGTAWYGIYARRLTQDADVEVYYGQDANGGIWSLELHAESVEQESQLLYKCHGGKVVDIAACPFDKYLISFGEDGRIYVYNYLTKVMVHHAEFPAKGTCMLWLPLELVPTGDIIFAGFDDGQVRVLMANLRQESNLSVKCVQVVKPHSSSVTTLSLNRRGTVLVTGGVDSTVFVFAINVTETYEVTLAPVGFVQAPDVVTCLTWHPQDEEVLVGCIHGQMMQVLVPDAPLDYTDVSYRLEVEPVFRNFVTYKSQIRRDILLREMEAMKAKKIAMKKKEIEQRKKENPGLNIDEETYLLDTEPEEELEPLYIPEVPNKILWLKYTADGTIWLSMGGYDAGYIYEYHIDQKSDVPFRFKMIDGADDVEISSYVYNSSGEYLVFAMQDGSIRVNMVDQEDFRDLSDYWTYTMHDNRNGFVPRMCFSYDERYFFSCGHDGNVFAYKFNSDSPLPPIPTAVERLARVEYVFGVEDVDGYKKLSLEQTKIKQDRDRILKLANERKARVKSVLRHLKESYTRLLQRNANLLPSQVIPREELELDQRVLEQVDRNLDDKLELVKRKAAYDLEKSTVQMNKLLAYLTDPLDLYPLIVKGFRDPRLELKSLRQRRIPQIFYDAMELVERTLEERKRMSTRGGERLQVVAEVSLASPSKTMTLEYFLLSLKARDLEGKDGTKLRKMLDKYRERREKWDRRKDEWTTFFAGKPVKGKNHPEDEKMLAEAEKTIGDYKLKESQDYKPPESLRETTVQKYKELLEAKLKQYSTRHDFTARVWQIRDLKYQIRDTLLEKQEELDKINADLPEEMIKHGPSIPEVDESEFPEHMLKPVLVEQDEDDLSEEGSVQKIVVGGELLELFLRDEAYPEVEEGFFLCSHRRDKFVACHGADFDELLDTSEDVPTTFEDQLRAMRLNRLVIAQQRIIDSMNADIVNFNILLVDVVNERLPVVLGGNFVDLHMITLNEDLNILERFEDGENQLARLVDDNQSAVHGLEDELAVIESKQAALEKTIENYITEEGKIQDKFRHATEGNKFYDFLKKVFRKKYKPPKIRLAEDESSSESSSSSSSEDTEEGDDESIDSRNFDIIRQDLNVCPRGCELAIYNMTVDLRTERHALEQKVRENNRSLEVVKKDTFLLKKKLNGLRAKLQKSQTELELFQREKQNTLNKVKCTVVITMDQICDLNIINANVDDFLIFSRTALSDLYRRVGMLERENFEQKSKYSTYKDHVMRMKKDEKFMRMKIKYLRNMIHRLMFERFGKKVNLQDLELANLQQQFQKSNINELEEVVLKKLVFELRLKLTDVKSFYELEFKIWNKKIAKAQQELIKIIQENTQKLELMQVVSRERRDLLKVIQMQPKKAATLICDMKHNRESLYNLGQLKAILERQELQLGELRRGIKILRSKGMVLEETTVTPCPKSDATRTTSDFAKYIPEELLEEEEDEEEEEEEEPTLEPEEVKVKAFYAEGFEEGKQFVEAILANILEDLDVKLDSGSAVQGVLDCIMRYNSVMDIVKDLIARLPIEEELRRSLEERASLKFGERAEEESSETINRFVDDLVDNTIQKATADVNVDNQEVLTKMTFALADNLNEEHIKSKKYVERAASKLKQAIGQGELDKIDIEELRQRVREVRGDAEEVVEDILNCLFDSSIKRTDSS